MLKLIKNKSPKGHKKAKYHRDYITYRWQIDYYPPKEGGLEAVRSSKNAVEGRSAFFFGELNFFEKMRSGMKFIDIL